MKPHHLGTNRTVCGGATLRRCSALLSWATVILLCGGVARAQQVVQVPVDAILNTRSVTTLTGGQLVPWTMGIDGGGLADGYMTAAASRFHNDPPTLKALPDDGRFPADARHPEVVLHFSNDAAPTSRQTRFIVGAGTFSFPVPPATYSKMFLFVTSSEGTSTLRVTLTYSDMTTAVVNIVVPDYYVNIPANGPVIFNLATDLPKWTRTHVVAEANHHNLTGLEINPTTSKTLTTIEVTKTAGGYFVFWGATGVATSSIPADAGADRPASDGARDGAAAGTEDASSADAGGGSGAGGTAGTAGTGGATGTGGVPGGAGSGGTGGSGGASRPDGPAGPAGPAGQDATPPRSTSRGGCVYAPGHRPSGNDGTRLPLVFAGWLVLVATVARRRRWIRRRSDQDDRLDGRPRQG